VDNPPASVTDHTREVSFVASLAGIALVLRFIGLGEGDFWLDELITYEIAKETPAGVGEAVLARESSPHLYYLLTWAWSGIFGGDEAGLRSLSAVTGALVTPVAYLTLRQVGLRTEAFIAAALAAVSPLLIWYSHEARVYSLFALLTAVAALFFIRTLVDFNPRALVGWSIASPAALLTHYFAVFTIAGMAAVLLYRHRNRWQPITLALLPTAVAGFALLPTLAGQRATERTGWIDEIPLNERVLQLAEHFVTGLTYPPLAVVLVAAVLAAAGGVGLVIHGQRGQLVGVSLLVVGAVTIALPLLAVAVNMDLLLSRNVLGAIVPLLLATSVGLGASRLRPFGPIVALALVCLLAGLSIAAEHDDAVERPPWGQVAEAIAEGGEPDIVVACCGFVAEPAHHYFTPYVEYGSSMGDIEVNEVVFATVRRPDHRPKDDYCWWGGVCQAAPAAVSDELSEAFAAVFDETETSTRGAIRLERYRALTPIPLGPQTTIKLGDDDLGVDDVGVAGYDVGVFVSRRLLGE